MNLLNYPAPCNREACVMLEAKGRRSKRSGTVLLRTQEPRVTSAVLRGSGLLLTQGRQVLLGNRCLLRPVVGRLERRIAAEDAVEGDEVRRLGQFGGDQRAPQIGRAHV